MRLSEFFYFLPESLIAQTALEDRGASRLMVIDRPVARGGGPNAVDPRDAQVTAHATFRDLPSYLDRNDVLVVNRSRVVPARLYARRKSGARLEVLFVRHRGEGEFEAWVRSIGRLREGELLRCEEDDRFGLRFLRQSGDREAILRLEAADGGRASLEDVLEDQGHVPLPPYIRRADTRGDRERYQTVYAHEKGSVAAPTAGLHFDDGLIAALKKRGVEIAPLVLHVGPGTFSPLDSEDVEANRLQSESFTIPAETLDLICDARQRGKRIVAVGTTVTRALETAHAKGWLDKKRPPGNLVDETDLFIYLGYKFEAIDRLITNFHLPRSSLLLLVCAFLGRERTLACYREAVERRYRFYSYGDAMLIR